MIRKENITPAGLPGVEAPKGLAEPAFLGSFKLGEAGLDDVRAGDCGLFPDGVPGHGVISA